MLGGEGAHSSSLPDGEREDHVQVSEEQGPSENLEQQSDMMDFINLSESGLGKSPHLQEIEQEKRKAEQGGKGMSKKSGKSKVYLSRLQQFGLFLFSIFSVVYPINNTAGVEG